MDNDATMKALDQILAENINELMRTHLLSSNEKVSSSTGLGTGTVQRIRRAESSATLKTIELLAQAFKVHPSTLITENLGRTTSKQGKGLSALSPAGKQLIERLTQLDRDQQSPPALYALIENALDLVQPVADGSDYSSLDDL